MTCMCLVSAAWKHRRQHRSSVWAVFIPAVTLRLLIQRVAPAATSKAAPKCLTLSSYMLCTHLHKQLFFTQLLTSAVFVYDTGMPRKQSYGKLCCRVWFWPPGCKSSVVPGQARSAALRGSEVVIEEGMKARRRFLWNLPLLSLRTGGWGGIGEVTYFWLCFQFATLCVHYFCFDMLRYELNFTMFCSLIPGLN